MKDKIKIIKIIKAGAMELNFIVAKNNVEMYVYSDFWPEDKTMLNKFMHSRIVAWTSDKNHFTKIDSNKKGIISEEGSRYVFDGRVIEINDKYVVLDAHFIINVERRDFMNQIKVGDMVRLEGVQIWAYDLQHIKN